MSKITIKNEVFKIINEVTKKYGKKITDKNIDLKLYKSGTIDSLDYIKIITDIETKLKIRINIDQLDNNFSANTLIKEIKKIIKN